MWREESVWVRSALGGLMVVVHGLVTLKGGFRLLRLIFRLADARRQGKRRHTRRPTHLHYNPVTV